MRASDARVEEQTSAMLVLDCFLLVFWCVMVQSLCVLYFCVVCDCVSTYSSVDLIKLRFESICFPLQNKIENFKNYDWTFDFRPLQMANHLSHRGVFVITCVHVGMAMLPEPSPACRIQS